MNYQDLAKHFGVPNIGQIRFSHAVNSQALLEKFASDPSIHILEGDISLSEEGEIIMAHPPAKTGGLTFVDWLTQSLESGKGVKLDFKEPETVTPCLKVLKESDLDGTVVILNADILVGPGGSFSTFGSFDFIQQCQKVNSKIILSLGWRTRLQEGFEYSASTVEKMLEIGNNSTNLVTFPIRVFYLRNSWKNLQSLLEDPNHSLTLWNNESVEPSLIAWFKENLDPQRTFFDLIHYPDGSPLTI